MNEAEPEVLEPPEYYHERWGANWGDGWAAYDPVTFNWPEFRGYTCLRPAMLDEAEHALRRGLTVGTHADGAEATALSAELSKRVGAITARFDEQAGMIYVRMHEPGERGTKTDP